MPGLQAVSKGASSSHREGRAKVFKAQVQIARTTNNVGDEAQDEPYLLIGRVVLEGGPVVVDVDKSRQNPVHVSPKVRWTRVCRLRTSPHSIGPGQRVEFVDPAATVKTSVRPIVAMAGGERHPIPGVLAILGSLNEEHSTSEATIGSIQRSVACLGGRTPEAMLEGYTDEHLIRPPRANRCSLAPPEHVGGLVQGVEEPIPARGGLTLRFLCQCVGWGIGKHRTPRGQCGGRRRRGRTWRSARWISMSAQYTGCGLRPGPS